MKAIIFDQPGDESVLRIGEVEKPAVGPGEIRVRVRATAVNRADLLQRQGLYPPPPGASPVLGLECAGEVIEIGPGAEGWRIGDRVMALLAGGGYAEQAVVHAGSVMAVPPGFSDAEAGAFCEVFLTAFLNIFRLGQPPERGSVLVHGGGSGVGTAAIRLCKEAGLGVIVTAGSEAKGQRCRTIGADYTINYRDGDFAPQVREFTGGKGVDVVLDCVGGRYLASNLQSLAPGGKLVIIGLMGGAKAEIDLAALLVRRLHVIGSTLRSRSAADKATIVQAFGERFGAALTAGRLRPVIDRTLPLDRAAEAHRIMAKSEHFGKIVLSV
jgi:putative PIG3 family NAD(P)H quinone oxidoreductase